MSKNTKSFNPITILVWTVVAILILIFDRGGRDSTEPEINPYHPYKNYADQERVRKIRFNYQQREIQLDLDEEYKRDQSLNSI